MKRRKNAESKKPKVEHITSRRTMLSSNSAVCCSKKLRFVKEKEASGLLSNLGLKTPLIKIPIFGDVLF